MKGDKVFILKHFHSLSSLTLYSMTKTETHYYNYDYYRLMKKMQATDLTQQTNFAGRTWLNCLDFWIYIWDFKKDRDSTIPALNLPSRPPFFQFLISFPNIRCRVKPTPRWRRGDSRPYSVTTAVATKRGCSNCLTLMLLSSVTSCTAVTPATLLDDWWD